MSYQPPIKLIRTEEDYELAVAMIRDLWDAAPGTAEHDMLEVFAMLVNDYESKRWPIEPPDPVDALKILMNERGLEQKDLEPAIGPAPRVSEILNRRQHLTLKMVWNLYRMFHIPAEILVRPYELARR